MTIRIYYANMLYGTTFYEPNHGFPSFWDLPEGIYLKFPADQEDYWPGLWYRKDLTPVLLEDVPKELLVLELLNPLNST